jgi:hypothetical protein
MCPVWTDACDTVLFVRVDEDAYIAYGLEGGP